MKKLKKQLAKLKMENPLKCSPSICGHPCITCHNQFIKWQEKILQLEDAIKKHREFGK